MEISDKDRARFEKYVNKTDGCWLWTGHKNYGYGHFRYKKTMIAAHRLSYMIYKGDIPEGLQICHTPIICHNRACVNPAHLTAKTRSENQADRILDGTNGNLSQSQVIEIRRLLTLGELTKTEIGKMFGVARQTITKISSGTTWSSLKPEDG
jgi:DNA-binding XRE family transcriptional regulator